MKIAKCRRANRCRSIKLLRRRRLETPHRRFTFRDPGSMLSNLDKFPAESPAISTDSPDKIFGIMFFGILADCSERNGRFSILEKSYNNKRRGSIALSRRKGHNRRMLCFRSSLGCRGHRHSAIFFIEIQVHSITSLDWSNKQTTSLERQLALCSEWNIERPPMSPWFEQ